MLVGFIALLASLLGSVAGNETAAQAATVPTGPGGLVVTPDVGSAVLSWPPPFTDGGSPITGFVITVLPGGRVFNTVTQVFVVGGLTPGETYSFTIASRNAVGIGSAFNSGPVTIPSTPVPPFTETIGPYSALTPTRILDTRNGTSAAPVKLPAGQVLVVKVTTNFGVPPFAPGALVNVTVTEPEASGHLTVYPCDTAIPTASNVNFVAGQTVPNLVSVRFDPAGRVCIYTSATTHVIADISGYFTPPGSQGTGYWPLTPARILDTRLAVGGPQKLPARQPSSLQVTGYGGVFPGVSGVAMNVTVTEPESAGFLTLYPCDTPVPNASNLNFEVGQTVPNLVNVRLDASGRVCLYSNANTHIVIDVAGYYARVGSLFSAVPPSRVLDTRTTTKLPGGQTLVVPISGRGGVGLTAASIVVNVTVTEPESAGFVTVYPCDAPRPLTSNLNAVAGQTVPNLVSVRLDSSGQICMFSTMTTHLIVDVAGYYVPF